MGLSTASTGRMPPGFMRPELWSSFQDILVANGLQETKVDVTKYVSNDYLPTQ